MADHDVISTISSCLGRVREAGIVQLARVRSTSPAVGLDTDGDVDLGHLERAADVANRVVVRVDALTRNGRILRGHRRGACVDAAVVGRVVCVDVCKRNGRQGVALEQAISGDLTTDSGRQLQLCSVILLACAVGGDGNLLLVEEGVHQGAILSDRFGNLDRVRGLGSVVARTLNGLVELPASNRRASQREGLANLQNLRVGASNRIAVHVDEVYRHLHVLVAGVVERDDVLVLVSSQDERLLDLVGIELDAIERGHSRIESRIVNRSSEFDNRGGVARNVLNGLRGRDRGASTSLAISDDVVHGIGGGIGLCDVHESNFVAIGGKLDRLAVLVRAIPSDGNGRLSDALTDYEVRVANFLIGSNGSAAFIHIVDGVAQRRARPVRIDRSVCSD